MRWGFHLVILFITSNSSLLWAADVNDAGRLHQVLAAKMLPDDDSWHERIERFLQDIKEDGRLMKSAKRFSLDTILIK